MPDTKTKALLAAERALSLFVELDRVEGCYCGPIVSGEPGRFTDSNGRECGWCEHARALAEVREALGGVHHREGLPVG